MEGGVTLGDVLNGTAFCVKPVRLAEVKLQAHRVADTE